jgi:hypothetical protein
LFSSDYRWLAFRTGGGTNNLEAVHSVELATGVYQTRLAKVDHILFSKSGKFVIGHDGETIRVFDTATLEPCATYRNPIQDKLWATEKILELQSTNKLGAVLTALGGKRLGADGTIQDVPPTEWLKLRAEAKPGGSFESTMERWILAWPKNRSKPPF